MCIILPWIISIVVIYLMLYVIFKKILLEIIIFIAGLFFITLILMYSYAIKDISFQTIPIPDLTAIVNSGMQIILGFVAILTIASYLLDKREEKKRIENNAKNPSIDPKS